jgi:hypothetical protein
MWDVNSRSLHFARDDDKGEGGASVWGLQCGMVNSRSLHFALLFWVEVFLLTHSADDDASHCQVENL